MGLIMAVILARFSDVCGPSEKVWAYCVKGHSHDTFRPNLSMDGRANLHGPNKACEACIVKSSLPPEQTVQAGVISPQRKMRVLGLWRLFGNFRQII